LLTDKEMPQSFYSGMDSVQEWGKQLNFDNQSTMSKIFDTTSSVVRQTDVFGTEDVKSRLISEQMKIMRTSQPKISWMKECMKKPIALSIVSFIVVALLLITLEPPFVLKEPEHELEKMKINFGRVIFISFVASVATYIVPLFILYSTQRHQSL
jgi:hypothetical protein